MVGLLNRRGFTCVALNVQMGEMMESILGAADPPRRGRTGKLGAVAVIRTGLNVFLSMEIKQEKPAEACEPSLAVFPPTGKEQGFPNSFSHQSK